MAEEIQEVGESSENRPEMNEESDQNGHAVDEMGEELDDAMFDDPEGFVDDISDQGLSV